MSHLHIFDFSVCQLLIFPSNSHISHVESDFSLISDQQVTHLFILNNSNEQWFDTGSSYTIMDVENTTHRLCHEKLIDSLNVSALDIRLYKLFWFRKYP